MDKNLIEEEEIKVPTKPRLKQDENKIGKIYSLFKEFKENTQLFRDKCKNNEEYWKTNHWHDKPAKSVGEPQPTTPILFSTAENLLSDIMDSFPSANIRGQGPEDVKLGQDLSEVIKFILEKRRYRKTFRQNKRSLIKKGASVTKVFWNKELYNGLGDVDIANIDIRSFYWDYKVDDVQDGRGCFITNWYSRQYFRDNYPSEYNLMKTDGIQKDDYQHTDAKKESDEIMELEYWYKTTKDGATKVHMKKLAGMVLIEDSEIDLNSMYEHGLYPFIVNALYPLEGEMVGLGVIDVFKSMQDSIDRLDQIIEKNARASSKLKVLVSEQAGINEDDLLNGDKEIVKGMRIDEGAIRWFQAQPLDPYVVSHMERKIGIIKEESGQNQFARGEGGKGVTAASAIRALQEAGSKRSRNIIDDVYDSFQDTVNMILELIKQFYEETRVIRIRGEREIELNNALLKYQTDKEGNIQTDETGSPLERYIEFDVSVTSQKANPYDSMYQNELAIQLKDKGMVDEITALEMMEFDGKEEVIASMRQKFNLEDKVAKLEEMVMQFTQKQQDPVMKQMAGGVEGAI